MPCLLACFFQIAFHLSAKAYLLYDVNFSSPPHTLEQPPVTGGDGPPRLTPSGIPNLFPGARVVQSEGTLTDQPCKFIVQAGNMYAQLCFGLSPNQGGFATIYPRYIVEMDLLPEQIVGQYNAFTIFFDAPLVRNIYFNPDGTVSCYDGKGFTTIGTYTLGNTVSIKVDIDLIRSSWKIWLNGKQVCNRPFYSNELLDFRLSLGDRGEYGNLAAVDNIKVYGIAESADLNRDNVVDMNDLDILAEQWLQDNCRDWDGCAGADIDDSNEVNFMDYSFLAARWLKKANSPPVVEAGTDQLINYPALSVNLNGTVSDDGQPAPPGVTTIQWSVQSGPGTVIFGDANALDTTANFSQAGIYVLCLTANDDQLITCDYVQIAINLAPIVEAGRNKIFALPDNFTVLEGFAYDDGLPNPPGLITTHWSQQSGPGIAYFGNENSALTMVTFLEFGTYVLRLTADDGVFTAYDETTIQYFEVMPENQAPDVNAGNDEQIFEPIITLNGSVTDDGLPDPPGVVTTEWSLQSGPGMVFLDNPNDLNTNVWFPDYGVYILRLTADDGELTSYDEVTITFQEQ